MKKESKRLGKYFSDAAYYSLYSSLYFNSSMFDDETCLFQEVEGPIYSEERVLGLLQQYGKN